VVEKGFFAEHLKKLNELNAKVPFLINHDYNQTIGTLDKLEEDETGLYYEFNLLKQYELNGTIVKSNTSQDLLFKILDGLYKYNSFQGEINYEDVYFDAGSETYYLRKGTITEGSILSVAPANIKAIAILKSENNLNDFKLQNAILDFCKKIDKI
jgi:hypothetical protein